MISRDQLTQFINQTLGQEILEKAAAKDELANGIQIHGSEEINKIALGVSCNAHFLEEAINFGAQACIFHHGFDPRTHKAQYSTYSQNRLRLIFQNNLSIYGFHGALDMHPTLGNNAQIIQKLGAKIQESLFEEWGFTAKFPKPIPIEDLEQKCLDLFDHDILSFLSGPEKITTIGVVSGAAKPYAQHIKEFQQKGVECYISGETSESTPHKMIESGINYLVCGHYATEVFGVKALGQKIQTHFGKKVQVQFIDIHNPV